MVTFLLTPFGRIIAGALGFLAFAGLVFGWYEVKISEAKKEVLSTFNQQQLEQTLKEKDALILQIQQLDKDKQDLQNKNSDLNKKLTDEESALNDFINSQKDTSLDPIFNKLLEQIRGNK